MVGIIAVAVVGSFLLSLACTAAIRSFAGRIGFVDRPGGHKQHAAAVPLGGGTAMLIAIFLPVLLGVLAARWLNAGEVSNSLPPVIRLHQSGIASKLSTVLMVLAGAVVLHVVGLIDDRRPLGALPKFVAQCLVAGWIAIPGGIRVVEALPAPASIALTMLWIVLVSNAFNFLDNVDGLCAGVAAIAASIFAVASLGAGQLFVPVFACVMVGGLLGFLVFNFAPASIFMGDAGSLVVGYLLAVVTILVTFYDPAENLRPLGVVVPLVVLAVPLYDVVSVVVHRVRAGQSPFRGDWRHFSHRLIRRGMSPRKAVLTIYLATAATGLPAIVLPRVDWPLAVLLLVQCVCVVVMIAILEHSGGSPAGKPS